METTKILRERLEIMHRQYDEEAELLRDNRKDIGPGYHTRLTGIVHETNKAAEYAAAVFFLREEEYYERAKKIFLKLSSLQDTDPTSRTFGLWSYYAEQSLAEMMAPDFNWSDFIGKQYIYVLSAREDCLDETTKAVMRRTLENAMECSIKRNVSADYTNISMASSMTILSAGELLNKEKFIEHGKKRLKKAYEYNMLNGAMSEYNSSAYTPLAISDITRMLMYFRDEECMKMAEDLHDMAWKTLSEHYDPFRAELASPQKRSYRDLDEGQLRDFLYIATDGLCGTEKDLQHVSLPFMMLPLACPKKYLDNFRRGGERFITETYYKKNNIRTPDEDTVIVKNINSPDLKAITYINEKFSLGAFTKSDLWTQRRTSSVIWGDGENNKSFRLRCINGSYDYCSGMAYTDIYKNFLLSHTGFVSDHGDYHYLLDKSHDGTVTTDKLMFCLELNDKEGTAEIKQNGNEYTITDKDIVINIRIVKWVFDGEAGKTEYDAKEKRICLLGYKGPEKKINIKDLRKTYAVFAIAVNDELPEVITDEEGDKITSTMQTAEKTLTVRSYTDIKAYDEVMEEMK